VSCVALWQVMDTVESSSMSMECASRIDIMRMSPGIIT
jgi:hypothetical protein